MAKPSRTLKSDPIERPWRGEFPTLSDLGERAFDCVQAAEIQCAIRAGVFPDIGTALLAGVLCCSQTIERLQLRLIEAHSELVGMHVCVCESCLGDLQIACADTTEGWLGPRQCASCGVPRFQSGMRLVRTRTLLELARRVAQ